MQGLDDEYWVPEHVREWLRSLGFSLLLDDLTKVACDDQACTDWLAAWMARTGSLASAQECVVRAFGLGTGAWALWVDAGSREVRVRRPGAATPEGCGRGVLLAWRISWRGFGGGLFSPCR